MRVVQLFNREEADIRSMEVVNRDYLEAQLRSVHYYALFFPIVEVFMAASLALIIAYGGGSVLSGEITVGVITSFLLYARRFFRPIQDLSEKYNLLQSAIASSERVCDLIDRDEEVADPEHPTPFPERLRGEIEFEDVWFAYNAPHDSGMETGSPEWRLRGISFRIAPGERVALVGQTGAGKTTIVHLLMRFYDPQRGRILLDGIPVQEFAQEALRQRIGLVLQDTFLFSEDIRYNIRLGSEDIPEERVEWAARAVGVEEIAERTAGGYDRQLGERGGSLSTGERQLISFARVLAMDPKILVLDEATSSVDSEIEARIEAATKVLLEGRTAVIVAHRLSTIRDADRILVLHSGELVEEGTHEELLERRGLYARLYELQFSGQR
jgi:ATP-binding cassette subfamily B protein